MPSTTAIEVYGARTHNLKDIDCRIPHDRVTVVTGLSGSGKSSLAFDTVYAEGQRRFVESISTYARQFLRQMERPPVREITNVLPAVALEAKNHVRNARSTVATLAEISDVLRLLFTHLGEIRCPNDGSLVRALTLDEIAGELDGGGVGERFVLLARIPRPKRQASAALSELVRQGYARIWVDGEVERLSSKSRWLKKLDPLRLVLGRFRAGRGGSRLPGAAEQALTMGGGVLEAVGVGVSRFFSRDLSCPECATRFRRLQPALFSFNSPLGACSECQGFGRVIGVDAERVVPDGSKSLGDRPIAPWNTKAYEDRYPRLFAACEEEGVPLDVPWDELSPEARDFVWRGKGQFTSLERFFRWLERRSYKVHVRVLLARYRAYDPCPVCNGRRLKDEACAARLLGASLPELYSMNVEDLVAWLAAAEWSPRQLEVGGHLIEELTERVGVLSRVGLDYLTLDRQARTLSGGETQRIQLAAALGSGLTSTLYVLDEPTIGLHPQDSDRLVELLRSVAGRGNTVLVVEHDRTLIEGADHIIDLGPAAGDLGGEVIAEGSLPEILESPDSATAAYLRIRTGTAARRHQARFHREKRGQGEGQARAGCRGGGAARFEIRGATANNLDNVDVSFPRGALVAVSGVSGSGKSTLVENVIYANVEGKRKVIDLDRGKCRELLGFDQVDEVLLVDQRPLGRSSRSNPVTYVKVYDQIRKLFASTPLARRHGITAGHFSFNVDKGRCQTCRGTGEVEVDMQFMAAVTVRCEQCQGRRFLDSVLAIKFRGLDIAQTLELSVDRALEHFAQHARLCRGLRQLADAGLGYLGLGRSTATLSGGEAQRLKLASFLGNGSSVKPRLLLFDEPTTGLHLADIDLLSRTLRRLVDSGHSVLVVEHSPDLIARCDWVVDLGPGGGVRGGRVLFSGPIERVLNTGEGPTASELRKHLQWEGDISVGSSARGSKVRSKVR
ncbi:MAG: excinuclease ABC subunit UvrA [Thermoanaerobaculia bacterium]